MKVKRFNAQNMQTALRLVAQELGDDAVIISTQKNTSGIEVVAAIDYQAHHTQADVNRQLRLQDELERAKHDLLGQGKQARLEQAKATDVSTQAGLADALQRLKQPAATAPIATAEASSLEIMKNEIRELKQLVLQQQQQQQQVATVTTATANQSWVYAQVQERCSEMGLDPQLSERLLANIGSASADTAWKQILIWLERHLPIAQYDCIEKGGAIALIGPTGAGKTTTIGKMAAQAVLRHGAEQVALVTLDNYRVAAHDQLKSFAKILGVELKIVPPSGDLNKTLAELKNKKNGAN